MHDQLTQSGSPKLDASNVEHGLMQQIGQTLAAVDFGNHNDSLDG
jgi:hypothetical protein